MNRAFVVLTMFLLIFSGCDPVSETTENVTDGGTHTHADGTTHANHSEESGHSHDAPHGGAVADWGGGKFHVEFTVDHEKQEATVYVLGSDCRTPAPIDAAKLNLAIEDPEFQADLIAKPLDSDGGRLCSRYVGTNENFGKAQTFSGKIFGSVAGQAFSGDFEELAHED